MRSWFRFVLVLLGLAVGMGLPATDVARAADRELAQDDGERQGKQSAAGTGHVVELDPGKGTWWLGAVRIHGARYGSGYDPATTTLRVSLCDTNLREIVGQTATYAAFPAGRFDWVEIPFERVAPVEGPFCVVVSFDPTATQGVYVGWTRAETASSAYGLPGGERRPVEEGRAWMIRPVLARKPARGAVRVQELAHDDGVQAGKRSLGGSAHVVEFKKPSGTWWIESVSIHGQPYGGGYDPAETPFTVTIADRKMKAIGATPSTYALFPRGDFRWVDVPLEEPLKAPATFRVVVDFDPSQTRGVYVGTSAGETGHAYVGRVGERAEAFPDATWMIRARLVSEKPAARPAPEATAKADPRRYRKDLEAIDALVRRHFPALEKKGVDWKAAVASVREAFESAPDDAAHVLNATQLLARLGDMHSGVVPAGVEVHVPAFDGQYGAGLWIAHDAGRLVLRAATPDHPLLARVPPGSVLLTIGGRPAAVVHEEVRQRMRRWYGWSSTHFLDARLSFQFFPFREASTLDATFLPPPSTSGSDGVVGVQLRRFAPDGRGLSRIAATLPESLEAKGGAVGAMLDEAIGYVRILGGQDEETRRAFDAALETVRGAKGLVLDCRGMGGGGDGPAWAMAGRFFAKARPLPHDPTLQPTPPWTFEAPVVLLQDERMVSSAETFTWAMVETGRAIAVGRKTGGATIIPQSFDVPSGLFRVRLGCRDRETSVRGVHPEGVGSEPDVPVPYAACVLAGRRDPVLDAGQDVLRLLLAGVDREAVVGVYGGILGADAERLAEHLDVFRSAAKPDDLAYPDLLDELVACWVEEELGVTDAEANPTPDALGARRRLARLEAVARVLGLDAVAEQAASAAARWRHEVEAQAAWDALAAGGLPPSPETRAAFLDAHEGTRWADAIRRAYPAAEGEDGR